ncbi:MAG: Ig-like domain-containing protein [Candidatus Azobacteroides sp.]|nr:Ig-like domain-containing protein [Candidatus Azobacteroides sp.]
MKQHIQSFLAWAFLLLAIYSCASIASPTGGPKDEAPPVFVRSVPEPNALNYDRNRVELYFDENIQLEKIGEKLLVSPPQKEMPVIKSSGKRITVEIKDTLQANTTYTIDFADAIVDNNEKNVLPHFVFSFSTGEIIDSLEVSGLLLNAADLEPVTGKLVGLHKNLDDSAFTTEPFYRIGSSDPYGNFSIKNLSEGTYRIYALNDLNRDYKFDQSGEDIAFTDSLIIPRFETRIKNDTIWQDSITIDTIYSYEYNKFLPDSIILFMFKEISTRNQFIQKQERLSANKFSIYLNAPAEDLPNIIPLDFTLEDWYVLEKNDTNDTLHFWIKHPMVYEKDTITLQIDYLKTDTAKQLVPATDTLFVATRVGRQARQNKKEEKDSIETVFFRPTVTTASTMEIYNPVYIEWESPVKDFDAEGILLEIKADTVWQPASYTFEQDSTRNIRTYKLTSKWEPGGEYRLTLDSLAFLSIYDTHNNTYQTNFKIKRLEEYGFLFFNLINLEGPAFVELLNKSDKVVQKAPVENNTAEFLFLKPDTYYARIILDENENGIWDTGNYAEKRQPEKVYYYPGSFKIIAHMEIEQDWDITAVPVEKQKPRELIQNKPKEKAASSDSR